MEKLKKLIKSFRGISFSLFELRANTWDGYGLTLGLFTWVYAKKITMSTTRNLFGINFRVSHSDGGKELLCICSLLFFRFTLFTKVLVPKKDRCHYCDDFCETKEHYNGNIPYCSEYCLEDDNN